LARRSTEAWISRVATSMLENGLVSVTFVDAPTFGFKFVALQRAGQPHVWGNDDGRLWSATLFDSDNPGGAPISLDPDHDHASALATTPNEFVAAWNALPALDTDKLNVTFRARLEAGEDFRRVSLTAPSG